MIDLSQYKKIHCIGIGGIGLSAIAEILLSRGYEVSGSDMKESAETVRLASKGARVFIGHRAENVEQADLLVFSAAVGQDNPEMKRAEERGIPILSRAQMLGLSEQYLCRTVHNAEFDLDEDCILAARDLCMYALAEIHSA